MNLISSLVEFLIILISHSICGIYSSTLKYSKKISYFVWAMWMFFQGTVFFIAEFIIKAEIIKFFMAFVFSLAGQYVIFFLTTKGRRAQRVFTMLTDSVFFCICSNKRFLSEVGICKNGIDSDYFKFGLDVLFFRICMSSMQKGFQEYKKRMVSVDFC